MALDPASSPSRIVGGLSELAPHYDVVLSDIWGVLHNGETHFPAAVEALTRFREGGGTVVLITNAPRPNGPIREQLDRLRVPRTAFDDVVTSGDVTIASILAQAGKPLFHIGPERDLALYEAVAALGPAPTLAPLDRAGFVVVTGLNGDETGVPEDYDAELDAMLGRQLALICANPDLVVHIGEALRYCAGAIAERYRAKGGQVIYAGKPHAAIYDACLRAAARLRGRPVDARRVLAIGDALRTDVAGAVLQGLDVLFVTSGIHRDETHRTGDGQLDTEAYQAMIAAAQHRPLAAIPALTW
ncbi:TIGR01459 family HAD-type hydrolase [Lichenihabitans sp. Uapishka_5]|uniref:TIGR01459 family HAD-type hydrolase n=1 Tax=Lichenihabitans sp. Uapishka_5 TaxID=3037302 RepID=UPI0029E80720|nr:TIGR01459 family HAD-type hydrolase [Lichenihabitans sp. Uapishka_5]MDX7952538.1 TIGR01459 family HAD-type hydrolase [Lichenihabitans sp. Uapishka_5]